MQALFWSGFPSGEIGGNCGKGGKGGYKAGIGIVLNFELPNFKIIFGGFLFYWEKFVFGCKPVYFCIGAWKKRGEKCKQS